MRAIVLLIIVLGSLPLILAKPYIGTLMWAWVSYFNPHRLTWDVVKVVPFALIVAVFTLGAWLVSREPKGLPRNAIIVLMLVFLAWASITTFFSLAPNIARPKLLEFVKIVVMSYVTFQLIQSKFRINSLVWVIVLSVGFYGVKGGVFAILTGGNYLVYGPDESAYGANNSVGLALAMVLPMMRYLQTQTKQRLIYWALMAAMVLTGIAVLATYSRGAFLAVAGMIGFLWLKSHHKVFTGFAAAIAIVIGLSVMPDKWYDRIESIQNYEQDWSSMERIKMWRHGLNIAADRPLVGGGFGIYPMGRFYPVYGLRVCGPEWFLMPATTYCVLKSRSSHSIYFDALGEHGYVGLILFLLLFLSGALAARRIGIQCTGREDLAWARNLSSMFQTSLFAFAVGGLFVNMTYFDLYYHILVVLAATQVVVARAISESEAESVQSRIGEARAVGGD